MLISSKTDSLDVYKNKHFFYLLSISIIGIIIVIGTISYNLFTSGNFVFYDDTFQVSNQSIAIADEADFKPALATLNSDSFVDSDGFTYSLIKFDEILQSEGQYVDLDHQYMAYSFFIKNTGNETISVLYYMRLTKVINSMDDFVRILIIEDDIDYRMYQKADQLDDEHNMPSYDQMPLGIDFETNLLIFRETIIDFKPGEIKSFRVIIWLEEQDPDKKNGQQSGIIETSLVFSIIENQHIGGNEIALVSDNRENLWFQITKICNVELGIQYEANDDT